MKTVSIRDLRYHFPKVQRLLEHGETVQITKRKRLWGHFLPLSHLPSHRCPISWGG
ncbi:MAG TPA: hypothetical protein VEV85_16160 [Bryobacteraceae bacterium]|nr:hypothetical protein [Bryobacteraceae bacterium]